MEATGRAAAERLQAAVAMQRRGAADELQALVDLVVDYDISIDDDLIDELLVSTVPGGALGTPEVHEFVHLELCGLLGLTAWQARTRIFEVLNLFYRHPTLWSAVQGLQLEVRRGCFAAMKCAGLGQADADVVGRQWFGQQVGLGWKAAMDLLDRLIIEADPAAAAERQAQQAAARDVVFWGQREGGVDMTARLDVLDAKYLDATLDQLADILSGQGSTVGWTKQALRSKALGIVATPALALAMQQQAFQPALLAEDQCNDDGDASASAGETADVRGVVDAETRRIDRDPHHCLGHVCGSVTVPPGKLQPKAKVYLHLDATDLNRLGGAVLVEKAGWLSTLSLKTMLGDRAVTIQPVIDLNRVPAEHQYRPSERMREAVQLVHPVEAFPFSHTSSRGLDLDHTVAYRGSWRDPQTGIGLLAPLSRRVHRAKTVAAWRATQRIAGEIVWSSPLGFLYLVTRERTFALTASNRNNIARE
ncbi:MAG: hypothetical protein Q4P15_09890 [Propionibacteriaceae bacterium]|nr:hypothetical protein [Propionibacteriaceae bacterium]